MKNNFYKNKVILVIGGAGSVGSQIVERLLKDNPKVIRVLDNNETGLFNLKQTFKSKKLRLLVGDVRDKERLKRAMEEVDVVFHAAALKHVPLCEYNPFEAVQTNVMGTQNVIDAALHIGVKRVINISTDKAVNPINVMGGTKLLAERLITAANYYRGGRKTIFSSVRFGNVLNSAGSVIPVFKEQIKRGGPVTITSKQMTRFFMAFPDAVDLVLRAGELMKGGEIFVLKMPALKIIDLANILIEELASKHNQNPKKIKIKMIDVRPGEKIHESLIAKEEASYIKERKDMFVLYNSLYSPKISNGINYLDYNSGNIPPLDKNQLKKILYTKKII